PRVLDGVYLDLAPVTFDVGDDIVEVTEAYLGLVDARREAGDGVDDRSTIIADLGVTSVTSAYDGAPALSLDAAVRLAAQVSEREETIRTFVADGTAFHADGAADAQELAYAVAAGLEYVRALMTAGLSAADALHQISFRLSATDDQFQSIAKFRAGRLMWARVAELLGVPEAGGAPQHAVASSAMGSRRSPWGAACSPPPPRSGARAAAPSPCPCCRSTAPCPAAWRAPPDPLPSGSPATPRCSCSRSRTWGTWSTRRAGPGTWSRSPTPWPSPRGRPSRPSRGRADSRPPSPRAPSRTRSPGSARRAMPTSPPGRRRSPASPSSRTRGRRHSSPPSAAGTTTGTVVPSKSCVIAPTPTSRPPAPGRLCSSPGSGPRPRPPGGSPSRPTSSPPEASRVGTHCSPEPTTTRRRAR